MHRVIRTILVASISSVSIAQAQDVVIPATIIAGRPHVQVMVNGRGPFWFGVDTGAEGIGRADARLVEALSLPMDSSVAVTDAITTQRQKTARIASLDLGGIVIRNAALPSKAYNISSVGGAPLMGILGRGFFADYTLTVDYRNSQIRISSRRLEPDAHTVSYDRPLRIMVDIAGRKREVLIDTGLNDVMHIPLTDTTGMLVDSLHFEREVGTTQNRLKLYRGLVRSEISVAGNRLDPINAAFTAEIPYFSIGYGVLKDYTLSIDQRSKLIRIAPQQTNDSAAVRAVLERYLHGLQYNDTSSLRAAFWPEAKLYYVNRKGDLGEWTQTSWYATFAGSVGKKEEGDLRIAAIDVTGNAASARIVEEYPKSRYVDYISLLRIQDRWWIVNKIYTVERR